MHLISKGGLKMDEIELARRAIRGDIPSQLQLLQLYKEPMYRIAYSYMRNAHDANDALQEMTFQCLKNIHKVREPQHFKTWLVRVIINTCLMMQRQQKRVLLTDIPMDQPKQMSQLFELNEAITKLPIEQQELIHLKYFQDLKNEIKKSKHYPINQQVTVDGQHFTIHELIISPIQSRLKMSVDPSNTKKILSFEDIRLYDENGEEWGKIRNGFTMHGNIEEQFSIMLESNYFRIPKSLTIKFTKIEAIDIKDTTIIADFDKKQIVSPPSSLPVEVTIRDHYAIEYSFATAQEDYEEISYYLVDAKGDIYYSSSRWLGPQQFMQSFEGEPLSPATIVISSFEQYLNGVEEIHVELK